MEKLQPFPVDLKKAKGDIIITLDGDLQDDPKEIPRLTEKLKNYEMVSG